MFEEQLKKIFNLEEVQGNNFQDIRFLLLSCWDLNELKTLWSELNKDKKFRKLSYFEMKEISSIKDKLKKKFMKDV